MSDYENAPATKMLATRCIICSKPLVDAESVEAGMGPTCRERCGYAGMAPGVRREANLIVHRIAVDRYSPDVLVRLAELRFSGLKNLAEKIEKAISPVKIEETSGKLFIEAPYIESSLGDWRRIPGRIFDRDTKRNVVPSERRTAVWVLLKKHYPGVQALGPKGLFVI